MKAYPWYSRVADNSLEQGDLIIDCPILIPPSEYREGGEYNLRIVDLNTIILSQSCDLAQRKIELVLVCPFSKLNEYLSQMPRDSQNPKARKKEIEELKKGNRVGYHLLNKDNEIESIEDYLLVDFKNVYGIQLKVLEEIVIKRNPRHRLLPPYREHLSQAFARYFMRVGLPQDIKIEGYGF